MASLLQWPAQYTSFSIWSNLALTLSIFASWLLWVRVIVSQTIFILAQFTPKWSHDYCFLWLRLKPFACNLAKQQTNTHGRPKTVRRRLLPWRHRYTIIIQQCRTATWRLAVDPMPRIRVVDMASVSIKPYIVVRLLCVRTTDTDAIVDKPLKHVVYVLICDDRQCGVPVWAKLSRFIPIQHRAICMEAILLTVHWVACGDCWYDIYDAQQNQ